MSCASTVPGASGLVASAGCDRAVAHVEEARLAADGQRAAAHELHARVLLRVVRGGDHDPALEPERADGEIDHLGADQPEVEDVGAGRRRAAITRPAIAGDESRMSRPTAIRRGSNCST